jgi:DNA polymerase-3 subunit delta
MYKKKETVPSIYTCISDLSGGTLLPIYFFFGEDSFTITSAVKAIEKKAAPLLTTDFDKETISAEKKANITSLIDLAYAFPFGSEKKLLIVKNFENYSDKKKFLSYIKSPSETTILVIVNNSKVNISSEPFKSLKKHNYIFEAKELKGVELEYWTKKRAKQLNLNVDTESVKMLIEIVGEDKSLVEMQLQKFRSFITTDNELTTEIVKSLSSGTKENNIFDLLNVLGKGNEKESLKIMNNLLEHGSSLVSIIAMLTKFLIVIARSFEIRTKIQNDWDAAREINISKYFYTNCKNATYFNNHYRLIKTVRVLYKTDIALKSSGIDEKTLSTLMLTEIFAE